MANFLSRNSFAPPVHWDISICFTKGIKIAFSLLQCGTSLTSSLLASLKESMVDDDDEESDHDDTRTPIAIDVRADHIVHEKPEPSPASLYRY